jgi:cytochrome bd-type quinol oxidase subunit 2
MTKAQIPACAGMMKVASRACFLVVLFIIISSVIIPSVNITHAQQPSSVEGSTAGSSVEGSTGGSSVEGSTSGGKFTLQNPLKVKSLGGLIEAFVEVFSYLVILFAVLALVYVGLQYILARGNPERMKELSNWLLWIMIGVAVVIGSRILVSVVINTLGNSGVVDQKVIQSANNALDGK